MGQSLQSARWELLALGVALLGALEVGLLAGLLWYLLQEQHRGRQLWQRYLTPAGNSRLEQVGDALARLPLPEPQQRLQYLCRWRNLDLPRAQHVTPALVLGQTLLYSLPLVALGLLLQQLPLVGTGLALGVLPLARVHNLAMRNRTVLRRSLPELLTLLAGEVEVGTPLEEALHRAASWGSPAAPLLAAALTRAGQDNIPLFSQLSGGGRQQRRGALLAVATEFGAADFREVAQQLDAVAGQGAGSAAALQRLSGHLITGVKQEMLAATEKLEDRLMVPLIIFFMPALLSITLLPMMIPIFGAFAAF